MKKGLLILNLIYLLQIASAMDFRTIIFTDYYGQIEPSTPYDSVRQRNYIRPELNLDFLDYTGSFTLSAEYFFDTFSDENIPDPFNILRECYLSFFLPWGDIIVGQKFTNKGKADVFSPLNIFNASYRELLSLDESYQGKRPELGLEVNYYINDDSSLEFMYIPFPRPDYQSSGEIDLEINNLKITLDKDTPPYITDNMNSFFLTYNRYSDNYDVQFTYGNFVDGNYNFKYNNTSKKLEKMFNRVQTFGGAISTTLGSVAIAEEIAFNLTEDFSGDDVGIKNSDITFNSQFMKTLFGRTFAQVSVIYQHIFNYTSEGELAEAVNDVHLQPTDNILFFIGHLHDSFLREKLYLALNIGFFFSPDIYLAPRINYTFTDRIKIETGADIYTGDYSNKLLEENLGGDNFFVRLKYEL